MTVEQFLDWVARQPTDQRYELSGGEAVAMAPECAGHAVLKAEIWRACSDAIRDAGLACSALIDGLGVRVDERTTFIPDVVVQGGRPLSGTDLFVPEPVVVVEVLAPHTSKVDTGEKLEGYFRLPSVQHFLIARTDREVVIHHRRDGDGIDTRLIATGTLNLDPPGLTLDLDAIHRAAALPESSP